MINARMTELGEKSSVIRELFEYGKKRKSEIGNDKVYDFSIGNPSVSAPDSVRDAAVGLLCDSDPIALHGYTAAVGDPETRRAIAAHITKEFGFPADMTDIYMTCGAAASLIVSLTALVCPGEEVVAFAPFFPEYKVFTEQTGAKLVKVMSRPGDFQIDLAALEAKMTEKTAALIVNSPNNPTGAVLTEETIIALSDFLEKKQKEYGHDIYLLADEPYRELVYGDVDVPYIPKYYSNTIVCYSYSKSLSLPGERIGYIFVSPRANNSRKIYSTVCGAGRSLGYVCAPALFQKTVALCQGQTSDLEVYKTNRTLLYNALITYGFEAVKPDGAFYLFVKSPEPDANAFSERAKKHEILVVPSDSFGCEGYVRISYCVDTDTIKNSLPAFSELAKSYGLTGKRTDL